MPYNPITNTGLPYFPWITEYTPIIPKMYWDVYSAEERVKTLCMEYDRICHYLGDVATHLNDQDTDIQTKLATITAHLSALDKITDELKTAFDQLTDNLPVYNPTNGKYENSTKTNRDIYRELAVFGARVNQLAQLTTEQAANHNCLETAVIGNYTIFGNKEPRVTPINGNTEPPVKQTEKLTVETLANGDIINKYMKQH